MKRETQVAQRSLFFLAEIFFGIASERANVERPVWRVEVDKVTFARIQFAKVPHPYVYPLQGEMAGEQHRLLANRRILVAPYRHVELAFGIDAPQAIEAGLVEVDEARRNLDALVKLVLAADVVVILF